MSTSQHPIEREELMAFLDGELPAERAASAAEHLKRCTECQKLASDLQQVSQALVSWEVEQAGIEIPAGIAAALDEKASRQRTSTSGRWAFRRFVAWPQFAWAGGLAAATLLVIAISVPSLLRSRPAADESAKIAQARAEAEAGKQQSGPGGDRGYATKLVREEPELSAASGRTPRKSKAKAVDANGNFSAFSRGASDEVSALPAPPPPVPMATPVPEPKPLPMASIARAKAPLSPPELVAQIQAIKNRNSQSAGSGGPMQRNQGNNFTSNAADIQNTAQVEASAAEITGPMVIRTAELALTSKDKDFDQAQSRVEEILKRHQGYVGEMNVNTPTGSARSLTATLRVPAYQLEATLAELKQMGRVEKESQNGEEVTQQYVDLEARLRNSRNTEQRLIELQRERTGKLSDVLSVEMQISRVRGEIEQMEGQRKAMRNQVDYATLTLTISEDYKAELKVVPPSTGTLIRNAAVDGYRSLVDGLLGLLLWLLAWLPSLLLWSVALFFPARYTWRRVKQHFGQRELVA